MGKLLGFLVRMALFALSFHYVLDYVFGCDYENKVGMSVLFAIIAATMVYYLLEGAHSALSNHECLRACGHSEPDGSVI